MADEEPRGGGGDTPSAATALRAPIAILFGLLLLSGVAYPGLIDLVAHAAVPGSADGSLERSSNGTAWGSSLLGQNITNPSLFWLRPSMIDDQALSGAGNEVPYGPTDPNLLSEIRFYISVDCGYLRPAVNSSGATTPYAACLNETVPIDLVSPSASGLDPDLTPAAVLVQIPRVASFSGLDQSRLTDLVNRAITSPFFSFFGGSYVNVLLLDQQLLGERAPFPVP